MYFNMAFLVEPLRSFNDVIAEDTISEQLEVDGLLANIGFRALLCPLSAMIIRASYLIDDKMASL